ncbi:MAG: hypothetical protein ACPGVU_16615 [Limisphaerales bacterium]
MNGPLSRREFSSRSIQTLLTIALVDQLAQADLLAATGQGVAVKWLRQVNEIGQDLRDEELQQLEWQKQVQKLFEEVEMSQFLKFIDFAKLESGVKWKDNGARSLRFKYPELKGVPRKLAFGQQIFALKKGRSVVPHGHNNMATAFLILKGNFHGQHWDRIEDEKDHIIIKPTIDDRFGAGGVSTVTDFKDNVHWFKALEDRSFIFNIHLLGVDPKSKQRTGRVYVDPKGKKIAGGLIRAPRMNSKESHKLYG